MIRLTRLMTRPFLLATSAFLLVLPWGQAIATPDPVTGQSNPVHDPSLPSPPSRPALTSAPKIWPAPPAAPPSTAPLKTDFTSLKEAGVQNIKSVLGPLTLQLDDGRVLQLSGLECPDDDPYAPGDIAVQAAETLKTALVGQKVRLYVTSDSRTGRMTRMGHTLAHLERLTDGVWVQSLLLTQGLARARPTATNPQMSASMLALEDAARQAKTGLWALEAYRVHSPENPEDIVDGFRIVEGIIESVSTTRNRIYMNFGKNWKKDFTVGLDPQARQIFSKAGLKPLEWNGRRVRVRGWVRSWNGPYMEINAPESLEFLDAGHVERMTPALDMLLPPSVPAPTVAPTSPAQPAARTARTSGPASVRNAQGGYFQVTPPDRTLTRNPDSPLAPAPDSELKETPGAPADRRVTSEPLAEPNR